jgi:hypothetical protein
LARALQSKANFIATRGAGRLLGKARQTKVRHGETNP